jgi:hypothetical protein
VTSPSSSKIYLGLLHYPVYNKHRKVISTAITPIDLHDISRSARTFGLSGFYVITPLERQQWLVRRIIRHWTEGHGAIYNPTRKEALKLIRLADTLELVLEEIEKNCGGRPRLVVTAARKFAGALDYRDMKHCIEKDDVPYLLLFGTGWGIVDEWAKRSDYLLSPIKGTRSDYNHLSVRSAVAIVLDRLFGT